MTQLSRDMDRLIEDINQGKYQIEENDNGKKLLKIDLERIFERAIKDKENQAEYIRNLEQDLKHCDELLIKFEGYEGKQ
jgi:uncharacterized protein (DUF2249 family)